MPAYNVERTILIHKPIDEVHAVLKDFRQWPAWSPWLIMEPAAKLDYSANQGKVGSSYTWDGELVGKGSLTLRDLSDHKIDMDLLFLSPFKSKARTFFNLMPEDQATRVSWSMDGKMPFFLFFMVKKMKAWIGMDYERGLSMLKEYIETGSVSSQVEIIGKSSTQPTHYIGLRETCRFEDIGEIMPGHFEKLSHYLDDNDLPKDITPFAIYHFMDMYSQKIGFTSAIPVSPNVKCPDGFECGEIPATKSIQINHTGSYPHLGNAWSAGMSYINAKKLKQQKTPMGYEYYLNDPKEIAPEELHTEIFIPLK